MKRKTILLLMAFIRELLGTLVYQSNIFPAQHLQDLMKSGEKLLEALEKE